MRIKRQINIFFRGLKNSSKFTKIVHIVFAFSTEEKKKKRI